MFWASPRGSGSDRGSQLPCLSYPSKLQAIIVIVLCMFRRCLALLSRLQQCQDSQLGGADTSDATGFWCRAEGLRLDAVQLVC